LVQTPNSRIAFFSTNKLKTPHHPHLFDDAPHDFLFWEMVSGDEPRRVEQLYYFEDWKTGANIEREPIPEYSHPKFKELILSCWQHNPSKRPTTDDLVNTLNKIGSECNKDHILVKACEHLETLIHPKQQEGLSYIPPYVTKQQVEEPIELYWSDREHLDTVAQKKFPNPPLSLEDTFQDFIKTPGSKTLLLLPEAGLGKTPNHIFMGR